MSRREDYDIVLRATDQTAAAFNSVKRNIDQVNGAVATLKGGFAGLAGLFIGQQIAQSVQDAVKSLGDLGSAAKRVGVTTDALQTLRFEAEQNGATAEDADAALQKFADSASKAATGSNYLALVLKKAGIELKDSVTGNIRPASALLEDYARLVANATSQQDKIRLATEAFGRQAGPLMVETLERIAKDGLQGAIDKAKQLGVVADKNLIEKADEIDKHWKQVTATIGTAFKSAVVNATGAVDGLLDKLGELSRLGLAAVFGNFAVGVERLKNGAGTRLTQSMADEFYGVSSVFKSTPAKPTNLPNEAIEKQIDSINKHVTALKADAAAVDATAGQHEYLRVKMELTRAAEEQGADTAKKYAKEIEGVAESARKAADALAVAKVQSNVAFERAQLGRTEAEAAAAAQLRSGGIDANSAQGEFLAQQIRVNEALKDTKALASDTLKGIVSDFRAGKSAAEVFGNALNKIADKLASLAIDSALSSLFKPAAGGAGGGLGGIIGGITKLFGFAEGGQFTVGGSGGTDSQVVAFRASPDENVRVTKPGQESGSGGNLQIVYSPSIDARGADSQAVAKLAKILEQDHKNFDARVRASVGRWVSNTPAALRA